MVLQKEDSVCGRGHDRLLKHLSIRTLEGVAGMKRGAILGAVITAAAATLVGWMALTGDPVRYTWFIGPGEIFAFFFLRGDNYHDYADMARHGVPAAIAIYTLAGTIIGAGLGKVCQALAKRRRGGADAI